MHISQKKSIFFFNDEVDVLVVALHEILFATKLFEGKGIGDQFIGGLPVFFYLGEIIPAFHFKFVEGFVQADLCNEVVVVEKQHPDPKDKNGVKKFVVEPVEDPAEHTHAKVSIVHIPFQ
jgi:hypothetical protein